MKNIRVYIIIINYNSFEYTSSCLLSLLNNTYNNYEIVLIDNASTDESYKKLQQQFGQQYNITIIKSQINLGFAGGNNLGIKHVLDKGGETFLLLNNDTEVDQNFLSILMTKNDGKSILVPRINYYDSPQTPWYAAGKFDKTKCIVKNGNPNIESCVSFATGCCMLFSKDVVDSIGLLNDSFFMYYEDVDYSLRALAAKINIIYIPTSIIYHKVGKSSGGEKSKLSIYYNNRNRFYLIKEHNLGMSAIVYTIITRFIRYITARVRNSNDIIIYQAFIDYCYKIKGKKDFENELYKKY